MDIKILQCCGAAHFDLDSQVSFKSE